MNPSQLTMSTSESQSASKSSSKVAEIQRIKKQPVKRQKSIAVRQFFVKFEFTMMQKMVINVTNKITKKQYDAEFNMTSFPKSLRKSLRTLQTLYNYIKRSKISDKVDVGADCTVFIKYVTEEETFIIKFNTEVREPIIMGGVVPSRSRIKRARQIAQASKVLFQEEHPGQTKLYPKAVKNEEQEPEPQQQIKLEHVQQPRYFDMNKMKECEEDIEALKQTMQQLTASLESVASEIAQIHDKQENGHHSWKRIHKKIRIRQKRKNHQ